MCLVFKGTHFIGFYANLHWCFLAANLKWRQKTGSDFSFVFKAHV